MWTPNRPGYKEPFSQTRDTGVSYEDAVLDLSGVLQGVVSRVDSLNLGNFEHSGLPILKCQVVSSDPPHLEIFPEGNEPGATSVRVLFEPPIPGHRYFATDAPYDTDPILEILAEHPPERFLEGWLPDESGWSWSIPGGWEFVEEAVESALFVAGNYVQCRIMDLCSEGIVGDAGDDQSNELKSLFLAYRAIVQALVETIDTRPSGDFALLNLVSSPVEGFHSALEALSALFPEVAEAVHLTHLRAIRIEMQGSKRISEETLDYYGFDAKESESARRERDQAIAFEDRISFEVLSKQTGLAEDWVNEYWRLIGRAAISEWLENEISLAEGFGKTEQFAKKKADLSAPAKPRQTAAQEPDNSVAITYLLVFGGGSLVGGILAMAIGFPPIVSMILMAPGVWLGLGGARSEWTTPEEAAAMATVAYQRAVDAWELAATARQEQLISNFYGLLHRFAALASGVPFRLNWEFAQESIRRASMRRSEWIDEITQWASRPEFPEPPAAQLNGISHKSYEDYCRDFLVSWGYLDAHVTRYSSDGGIDIHSKELVVQCKHYAQGSVGVRETREIFGVAVSEAKQAVIFTSGKFSSAAMEFADKNGVGLFVLREKDGVVRYQNHAAREIALRKHST